MSHFFSTLTSQLRPSRSFFFEFLITKDICAFLYNLFKPYNPVKNAHLTYWAVIDSLNGHFHEPVSLSQTFFICLDKFLSIAVYSFQAFPPPLTWFTSICCTPCDFYFTPSSLSSVPNPISSVSVSSSGIHYLARWFVFSH